MSSFGQYVHLNWANYEKYGTYEKQTGNKKEFNKKTNFQPNIFKKHRNLVLLQAKRLKYKNLKKLENDYNKLNYDAYSTLKGIASGKNREAGMRALLQLVNKQWSPEQIDKIISGLKWNDATNRFIYTGPPLSTLQIETKGALFVRISETPNTKFYARPFYSRLNNLSTAITESLGGMNPYEEQINIIKQNIIKCENIKMKKSALETSIANISSEPSGTLYVSDPNVFETIVQPFNRIIDDFLSKKSINEQLAYRIPEIIGQIASDGTYKLAQKEIVKALEGMKSTGLAYTEKTGVFVKFKGLDQQTLIEAASGELKSAIIKNKNGDSVSYSIKNIGEGRQQKADIEWIVNSNERNSMLGISMKSTHMQKINAPNISLQTSSLMLYLAGLQNLQENLGNHYLNVLSEHEDGQIGKYSKMRREAEDALTLAIAYSALSGKNQLRSGGQASILAIYDRATKLPNGTPRIVFFDIGTIIEQLNINMDGIQLSPSLEDISFKNKKVEGEEEIRKLSNKRITNILIEARAKTISASLSKTFLNSIRNNT